MQARPIKIKQKTTLSLFILTPKTHTHTLKSENSLKKKKNKRRKKKKKKKKEEGGGANLAFLAILDSFLRFSSHNKVSSANHKLLYYV